MQPPSTDLQNVRCSSLAMAIEHSSAYPATTERRVHTGNLAVSDKQDFGYFGYLDSHSNIDICSMDSSRILGSLRQVPSVQRFDVSRNGREHALSTGPCTWIRCAAFTNDPIAVAVILREKLAIRPILPATCFVITHSQLKIPRITQSVRRCNLTELQLSRRKCIPLRAAGKLQTIGRALSYIHP